MTTTTEAKTGAQPDAWESFDDFRVSITDFPAIAADPQTFAGYLLDQAGYYRSLDAEFAIKLAEILESHAARIRPEFTPEQLEAYKPFEPAF